MFWKKDSGTLAKPISIPELAGRYLVVEAKKSPDWVWNLKAVMRPADKKKAQYCRVFDPAQTAQAGIEVSDWSSLDNHPELIVLEGYVDKETNTVRVEKFKNAAA